MKIFKSSDTLKNVALATNIALIMISIMLIAAILLKFKIILGVITIVFYLFLVVDIITLIISFLHSKQDMEE